MSQNQLKYQKIDGYQGMSKQDWAIKDYHEKKKTVADTVLMTMKKWTKAEEKIANNIMTWIYQCCPKYPKCSCSQNIIQQRLSNNKKISEKQPF